MKRGMMHSFLVVLSTSGPQLSLKGSFRAGCTKNASASAGVCLVWFALCQSLQNPRSYSSKCAIPIPKNSLPFLWTPNNICVT